MQKNVLRKLLKCHKFDFILGAVLLLAALCLFIVFRNLEKTGGRVVVQQDNEIVGEYSLSEDGEYVFKTFYGSNTLVIKNGEAYVKNSTCRDHICEETGAISKVGDTIICLPNTLFITVTEGEPSEYDAIVR